MSKITKVKNGEYIGANKYTIKDAGDGKSTVDFAPDSILTPGTAVGAEILNEIQMNGVYTLDTNRVIEGQKEVYVVNLEGFTEFDNPDLNFNLKINSENTNSQTYLRLNNIDYLIECKIGNLKAGSIVYAKKINNTIKIIGNKNFGTNEGDILEGSKLAEILGIEYAGILNNTEPKIVGNAYYDTATKEMYICIKATSINYADATYFTAFSNNALLGKLQNLDAIDTFTQNLHQSVSNVMSANFTIFATKRGNVVTLNINVTPTAIGQGTKTEILNLILPKEFRPEVASRGIVFPDATVRYHPFTVTIEGLIIYTFSGEGYTNVNNGMAGTLTYVTSFSQ